jgi:hypothetical protein
MTFNEIEKSEAYRKSGLGLSKRGLEFNRGLGFHSSSEDKAQPRCEYASV